MSHTSLGDVYALLSVIGVTRVAAVQQAHTTYTKGSASGFQLNSKIPPLNLPSPLLPLQPLSLLLIILTIAMYSTYVSQTLQLEMWFMTFNTWTTICQITHSNHFCSPHLQYAHITSLSQWQQQMNEIPLSAFIQMTALRNASDWLEQTWACVSQKSSSLSLSTSHERICTDRVKMNL